MARARAETPGCAHVTHFNNAGAALPPAAVLDAVVGHLQREATIGAYEAAEESIERTEHTYDAIATLLGCARDEIAIVENATRAWDMAFYSLRLGPGDRVLTGHAEYASNFIALRHVTERTGATIEVVPDDEAGQIDVARLAELVDDRVKVVSLVHVPTQGGLVNPAAEVGRICQEAGVPLLLDACQSVGQMPVDVDDIGATMLSGTSRKFLRGPRGVGFLYVRREAIDGLEPPFLDLHAADWRPDGSIRVRPDARRFETWERNDAAKLGLGVAVDYALGWGIDGIEERVRALAEALRAALNDIPGVTVHDRGRERCAIVTFTADGIEADDVAARLRAETINVSVTRVAQSRLDLGPRHLDALVRASVHYYNSEAELDRLVAAVAGIT